MKKIVGILLISSLLLSNTGGLVVYANTNTDLEGNNESSTAVENVEEPVLEEPTLLEEQKVPEEPTLEESTLEEQILEEPAPPEETVEEQASSENEPLEKSTISSYVADVTAPIIDLSTLKVSKIEATLKDEVKISVKVTDDIQMDSVTIYYVMPITKKDKVIRLSYNAETDLYETTLEIDDTYESGTWKLRTVQASDAAKNYSYSQNKEVKSGGTDDLSSADFMVYGNNADVIAPVIDLSTLKISQTEASLDNEIKLSFKVTDDIQMNSVTIYYVMPITKKDKVIRLSYNAETDLYETTLEIDDTYESGTWKLRTIQASDAAKNYSYSQNKEVKLWGTDDLSSADFTIYGNNADVIAPVIDLSTLKISQTEATLDNEIKLSVKVTDDIQMNSVTIYYVMPITKKDKVIRLSYNAETDLYETTLEIDDTYESGTWKLRTVQASDAAKNYSYSQNKEVKLWGTDDLSSADFTVYEKDIYEKYKNISKLDNVTVLKENQAISNTTIDGDVYIGPDAVVTFNNVNVTGSIYVLGALKANSIIVSGSISASYFNWGGNPALYNGTVLMSGSNSISSMNASNTPVTEMPIRIDSNLLQSINGNLSFNGATVDVADMYVNNQLIDTSYDGRFIVDKLFVNDTNEISILWNTVFGNTITKNYSIDKAILSDTGEIHHQPMLETQNLTFNLGDKIDLLAGVSANDQEDGDLTDKIVIESNTIDKMKRGTYQVVYSVTDSLGAKETKSISVTLINPQILSVGLNKAALTLNSEETFGLTANIVEQDDPNYEIKWESSNEKVATVDANGLVTAIAPGNATITVTAADKSAPSKIEVVSPLKSISLDNNTANIEKGNSKNLTINYAPINTTDDKSAIWTSSNPKVATVDGIGKVIALSAGTATITAKVGSKTATSTVKISETVPSVSYTTHIQSYGWMSEVKDGKLAGTEGKRKRMEAIKVSIKNNLDLGITYSTHVQKNGWMNWVSDGIVSGTSGEAKRLEAIKIKLTGTDANNYDVYYRVHAEKNGWLGWAKNGEEAGTEGFSRRLEAIEIVIVKKGAAAPGSISNAFVKKEIIPTISYTTHVQSIGWQSWVKDGTVAGTSGKAKRLEGIKIKLENLPYAGGVQYKTHVQSYGWQGWSTNSALSGTSGKAKRLEAIQIQLIGEMAEKYDVYYRVHAQSYGWLGWAKNGESSGSEGKSKRLEAIEIRLIKKGNKAPGSTSTKFINK